MTTPDGAARIHWIEHGEERSARWRSESGWPAPRKVVLADDTMSADAAWRHALDGTALLWRGDFQNARQLLQALVRHKFDATAIAPGHITARFERRWSSFEVDILYTESSYSVRYRNSKRMDFDARHQRIDEAYNEQLALLGAQVQDQFDVVLQRLNRVAQKRIRRSFKV